MRKYSRGVRCALLTWVGEQATDSWKCSFCVVCPRSYFVIEQGHVSRPSPLLRGLRTWRCCKLAPHRVPTSGIHSSFPLLGFFVINILIIQMMVSLQHFHIYIYNAFYSYSPFITSLNPLPLPLITSSS